MDVKRFLFLFAAGAGTAWGANPLPTDLLVRAGQDLHYFGDCRISINRLEPGVTQESTLNAPACSTYWHTNTEAPSWVLDQTPFYGQVLLPQNVTRFRCALIHQQIVVVNLSAKLSLIVECPGDGEGEAVYRNGFDGASPVRAG